MKAQAPLWSTPVEKPIQQQGEVRLMSSMTRNIEIRRLRKGGAKGPWAEEDLVVAPILTGDEKLPSNLKLAVDAWPKKEDEVDGELHQLGSTVIAHRSRQTDIAVSIAI